MALSRLLDISCRSLGVYQSALDITSHNVSNADNPNYTRQRVVLTSEKSERTANFEWGTGVRISDITRVRNKVIDTQIRSYNSKVNDNNKRSELLSQVETQLSEPSDMGLSNLITQFFGSWDKLAVTPNSESLRSDVIQAAQQMTTKIKNVSDGLGQLKADITTEINDKVTDVNNYLKQIQALNRQIADATVSNNPANDLQDQRDEAINELSKLTNISVSYSKDGGANILLGSIFAVDTFSAIQIKADVNDGKLSIYTSDGGAKISLTGGELNALTDTYSNTIPGYQAKIDNIASTIMNSVNSVHSTGYNLQTPPETGMDFFTGYSGGDLVINENILRNPNNIAISSTGESGNGSLAIRIGGLADSKLIEGKTVSEYYSSLVSEIGTDKSLNDKSSESNQLVLNQLDAQKTNYSGVSIDEEMTNIIKFQKAYQASAKLIKVGDELLQTLLQMV